MTGRRVFGCGTCGLRRRRRGGAVAAGICMLATALLVSPATAHGRGRSEPPAGPDAAFADSAASGNAPAGHAPFSGVVTDAGGAPLPEVSVAMCASACWPTTTDQSGRFFYPSLPVERYVLDVRGGSVAGRTLTSVVLPVELTASGRHLPPVQLHDAAAIGWEGTAPVEFAGLTLVPAGPVDLGALQRATGAGGGAASAVIGGARIPPEAWPEYELAAHDARYRPLAMWALYPFGARLGAPLALQAVPPPEFDGDGGDLAFFSVDDVTGTAEWLGEALPERGGLGTGADGGISTLTWVILAARDR